MKDIDRLPDARQDDPGAVDIVVLCTANVCRSVMAAALLARRLSELGVAAHVRSAGMLRAGDPPDAEAISVMARYGTDITGHRSHVVCAGDLARASLVLAMARDSQRRRQIGRAHV